MYFYIKQHENVWNHFSFTKLIPLIRLSLPTKLLEALDTN